MSLPLPYSPALTQILAYSPILTLLITLKAALIGELEESIKCNLPWS